MDLVLCFDLGGTEIKYGIYNRNGSIYQEYPNIPTVDEKIPVMKRVEDIISQLILREKIAGLAFSSTGVIDSREGQVLYAGYTMPQYTGTQIKAKFEKKFHIPCEVENDVNCACLSEARFGAGKGCSSVVCITVGTGIGGAVFLDGKLFSGIGYTAGEIGYTIVNGQYFQDIASATFLVRRVNELYGDGKCRNGREIFLEAKAGNQFCIQAIDELIDYLTTGLINIIYLLNPEVIILGGGIMNQKEYLAPIINEMIERKIIAPIFNKTQIRFANQENKAGMLGALLYFNEVHSVSRLL